jgi:sugar O-acyltransferase (sialic acid O-acetyltransferase NeuD family)
MLILGAGGFANQVLFAMQRMDATLNPAFFCDPEFQVDTHLNQQFKLLRSVQLAKHYLETVDNRFCLGTGVRTNRAEMCERFEKIGGTLTSVIDPSAVLPTGLLNNLSGVICLAQAIVEPTCSIGKGVILNLGSMVTHQVSVGDFAEIGPGVKLLGKSKVGTQSFLGAGSIVLPGVKIGDFVTVGAGSVVTKDLPNGVMAYGNPARIVTRK